MDNGRTDLILAGVFLAVVAGGVLDLLLDAPDAWLSSHVLFEACLILLSLGLALRLWSGWREASRSLHDVQDVLTRRSAEVDEWRSKAQVALDGLSAAINRRLRDWGLTAAEREVALLLLKGHSHKEVAQITGRSERTVRQHAVVVYNKSGLSGRAQLAGFFLGDLRIPEED